MHSNFVEDFGEEHHFQPHSPTDTAGDVSTSRPLSTSSSKKKRNLPGNPDPDAEVVALSPRTLMATNRYICEVCHKGFQRDQNLQLHRRGHNLPWKLKQRPATQAKKRVYVCPEPNCVHHNPARALGDLTGIKKHYCRKHGDKKWKCDKCSKRYAVQSDWKAHAKICGTREYRCDCGTIFSRKDSFVTHRAFCDALNEENYMAKHNAGGAMVQNHAEEVLSASIDLSCHEPLSLSTHGMMMAGSFNPFYSPRTLKPAGIGGLSSPPLAADSAYTSATALLQRAAQMGSKTSDSTSLSPILLRGFTGYLTQTRNVADKGSSEAGFNTAAPQISTASSGILRGDVAEMGIYDLSVFMGSSGGGHSSGLVLQEQEKMTVDFLGVAAPTFSGATEYGDERQCLEDVHSQW
ncbi:zinc finger protein GAI-ASSOCIATED FACTOR 1-like [Salvia hispanica]|uniref:zinc finger protein GAI-ASSOCIATED FACTOR 1-like n=1 Tax=Salvia hispanica TaxID=49212 RepID=UPI0020095D02|nr:zinc finger protein GAI-ASSOCIATED FACTOR 1-like [Salvia hispanica]